VLRRWEASRIAAATASRAMVVNLSFCMPTFYGLLAWSQVIYYVQTQIMPTGPDAPAEDPVGVIYPTATRAIVVSDW
jgi:hypothetical protein